MTVATGTLTGTLQDPTGAPLVGAKITAAPQVRGSILAHGVVVTAGPVSATTDATGHFTLTLTATDDPATTPTGFTYRVTITPPAGVQQWFDPFSISVPSGSTLDLSQIAPAATSYGTATTPVASVGIDSTGTPYLLSTVAQDGTTQPDSKRLVVYAKMASLNPAATHPGLYTLAGSAVSNGVPVKTVSGITPDSAGNVALPALSIDYTTAVGLSIRPSAPTGWSFRVYGGASTQPAPTWLAPQDYWDATS